ncbi:MAG: TetR/AcrR family transcriptional regulator [Actinomyces ruminicola]|nr:TetR/AcrR family transcriptional regulator [Actinomyces ruminicola]
MSESAAPQGSRPVRLSPATPIAPEATEPVPAQPVSATAPAPGRRRGPRSGSRTPGSETTREAILDAARSSFLAKGFAKTTIRGVARAAGVDPALVSYYFGSKGDLFGASMNLRIRASEEIAKVVSGDIRTAGPRLVRLAMTAWDDSAGGATFRALLRWVATDDGAPEAVQTYATEQIATPVMQALEQVGVLGPDARERATLAASQLVGLAMIRYTFQVEPVASASVDHLVEVVGPTIQHYLTGPLLRR